MEIVKDKETEMDELNVGDYFLYGTSVIAQKQNKVIGDSISYFKIIDKKSHGGVEYIPVFDYMEKDKGEE
jgi:hypothetical protein